VLRIFHVKARIGLRDLRLGLPRLLAVGLGDRAFDRALADAVLGGDRDGLLLELVLLASAAFGNFAILARFLAGRDRGRRLGLPAAAW
jgi:hypothetical protein